MASNGTRNVNRKEDRWSTIPREILAQILNRLDNVLTDLVQCGAVCKWWQSVLLENHPTLTAGIPMLMFSPRCNPLEHAVLDISTNRLYRLPYLFNNDFNKFIIRSSFGWLVTATNSVVQFLNPITRAYVSLPPGNEFLKVVLSLDPTYSDCMVMAISWHWNERRLSFCRVGDEKWTMLAHKTEELCLYDDLVYHKDRFYAITQAGVVVACDLSPDPKVTVVSVHYKPKKVDNLRCLASAGEDLIMVITDNMCQKNELDIFKLNIASKEWEELKSLDDRMLFVTGKGSNFMSISANEMYGCKPNCVYFDNMLVYDLEDKNIGMFNSWHRFWHVPVNWITLPQVLQSPQFTELGKPFNSQLHGASEGEGEGDRR